MMLSLYDAIKLIQERGASASSQEILKCVSTVLSAKKKDYEALGMPTSDNDAKRLVDEIIWRHISAQAKVFNCGGLGYLLYKGQRPIAVSPGSIEFSGLLMRYGINAGSELRTQIGKQINAKCVLEGIQTEIQRTFHYDEQNGVAYFAEGNEKLLRITKDSIERVDNGTDNQLFVTPDDYEAFTVDLEHLPKLNKALHVQQGTALYETLFGGLALEE